MRSRRRRGLELGVAYDGVRIEAGAGAPAPFAVLSLAPADVDEPLPVRLLHERRTSRLPYDGRTVPDRVLEELRALARRGGHEVRWSSDPALVARILALNEETLFFDMTDATARREIGRWLRFSAAEAECFGDGFSPAALGFPGPLLRLFFHAHRVVELPGAREAVRGLYGRLVTADSALRPLYTVFGRVDDEGLATLDRIAAGGIAATPEDPAPVDGAPALPVEILRATRGQ